jgi:hypothetical protein
VSQLRTQTAAAAVRGVTPAAVFLLTCNSLFGLSLSSGAGARSVRARRNGTPPCPVAAGMTKGGFDMRRAALAVFLVSLFALPALAAAETWANVSLVDKNCSEKVKADPDKHETSCLLMCAKSGFGILTTDGTWVKLDAKGNQEALKALKATSKESGIRVTVTGEREGDTIKVQTLKID